MATKMLPNRISTSHVAGSFSEGFKLLIKRISRQTLDPDLLKNYRPVSNLHFLSNCRKGCDTETGSTAL